MKKTRMIVSVIAFTLAVSLSSFSHTNTRRTGSWFAISNPAHPELASSYTYSGTSNPCSGNNVLCAISGTRQASPNQNRPTQSSVDAAKSSSSNFTVPVAGVVAFQAN